MLSEPATHPGIWPLSLAGGIGGKRISASDTSAAINAKLGLIPAEILARFAPMQLSLAMVPALRAPTVYSSVLTGAAARQQVGRVSGLGSLVAWNGLYEALSHRIGVLGDWAVVHEFGHHVDQAYGIYVDSTRVPLTDREPFASLWTAAYPTIPDYLFGRSNKLEWFAELWTVQLDASYTGAGTGSAHLFVDLAGGSIPRATALRAAFVAAFPELPPFTMS